MPDSPLVSIAMATFNGERFLREQLDSIRAQSYGHVEIVISDDCSVDGTAEILQEYALFDSRIRLLLNDNRLGFIGNFERAIAACEGEIIFLSDQDDIWFTNKVETLSFALADALLIHSDAELVDSEGRILAPSFNAIKRVYHGVDALGALLNGNFITGCTIAFRRELIAKALPFPRIIPHDYWLALIAALYAGVRAYSGVLTKYRQHSANVLGAGFDKVDCNQINTGYEICKAKLNQSKAKTRAIDDIVVLLGSRMSPRQQRMAKGLREYYLSYCTKALRVRAMLFFFTYRRRIFSKLRGIDCLKRGLSSLLGYRLEQRISQFRYALHR